MLEIRYQCFPIVLAHIFLMLEEIWKDLLVSFLDANEVEMYIFFPISKFDYNLAKGERTFIKLTRIAKIPNFALVVFK